MRVLVINNISAGNSGADLYDFLRAFSHDGDEIVMRTTDSTTRVETMVTDAGTFDAVVVAGGDGTASSALYAIRDAYTPTLILPLGTGNLLSLNLDSPIEAHAFAKLLRECHTMDFDLGEISFDDRTVGFSMIAGAGYDATIMENAAKLKATMGENAYFMAAFTNQNPKVSHFILKLDGKVHESDGIAVLLVNFGKIPMDISVTPGNNPRDGYLEVLVIRYQNAVQLLPTILSALTRGGVYTMHGDGLELFKAHEVELDCDPPLNIQYDGEPTGITTPFTARALHRAARLIVDPTSEGVKALAQLEDPS